MKYLGLATIQNTSMNIGNQSGTIEAFYINLLSSVEAAFQEVYEDYVENYDKFEMTVIDLQNRRVTEKKSAMLFGRLLVEEPLREVYVENLREKDIQSLFRGIDAVFAKKYPEGIVTYDGYLIKRPEIEITLPAEGQTLAKIALGQETRETMMVKDVECGYDNRVFDNPGPDSVENLHYQRRPSDAGPRFSTTL